MASLTDWSQFLALKSISTLTQCFDTEENMRTVGAFGSLYTMCSPKRRSRARDNIKRSFPEIKNDKADALVEASIRNMFQLFAVDSLAMPRQVTPEKWPDRVHVDGVEDALALLNKPGGALLLTGHTGNWELLGFFLSLLGFKMTALARPIDNPLINNWLLGLRQRYGLSVLTKFGATNAIDNLLNTGERIGFIADQNAGDKGLFVPFLGRMASSYKSIGLLALRHEIPVIVATAQRVPDRFEYSIRVSDVIQPDDWADQKDPLFYITARFNRAIEEIVRLAPEQYLWVHRRWKSRPRWEREGKPLPPRVIAKLEALPWMTEASLERLHLNTRIDAGLEPLELPFDSSSA